MSRFYLCPIIIIVCRQIRGEKAKNVTFYIFLSNFVSRKIPTNNVPGYANDRLSGSTSLRGDHWYEALATSFTLPWHVKTNCPGLSNPSDR